jgi:hypothetical protein
VCRNGRYTERTAAAALSILFVLFLIRETRGMELEQM